MKNTALVTGGNRGIGLEVCRQLAGQVSPLYSPHVIEIADRP